MKKSLLMDFVPNKQTNSIHIKREFDAELPLVWDAWTKPEILDLWWAPKPYITKTKSMDFKVGGAWHYAMISTENETHWCRADYKSIDMQKSYSCLDAFCDENGKINEEFPRSLWNNKFIQNQNTTFVEITIQYEKLEDLEKIVEFGFKEGLTAALTNLDQYIEAQFKIRKELKTDNKARVCSYLNFPGNTEEAMNFYKTIFNSEFSGSGIQRFGDLPADPSQPPMEEGLKKMILHVELPIIGNHVLMATDSPKEMGFTLTQGNNMHISLEPESREETKRIFEALSAGGNVSMPLQDMFWGTYFGSFTDKYGINWMLNYSE